jgi:hypothetical protein
MVMRIKHMVSPCRDTLKSNGLSVEAGPSRRPLTQLVLLGPLLVISTHTQNMPQ